MNQIELVQVPIIKHKLQEIGAEVTYRISKLNLENQVATVDTIKVLKEMRADLNKELAEFEGQRKFIKEGVNNPYLEFEAIYKTEISEKYKAGIDTLKDKIAAFEDSIKEEKRKAVQAYFSELCAAEKIDFISFEALNLDINLTISEKKYKEQVNEYITKVLDDLALIKSSDFEAETLTEYKRTLNVSNAIVTVKQRKEAEKLEAERISAERMIKRQRACNDIGLRYETMTQAWEYNSEIFILQSDIDNLSNEDFILKFTSIEAMILQDKQQNAAMPNLAQEPVTPPIVQAPKIVEPAKDEPIKVAQFEVRATMAKLRLLGEFMRQNAIEYKNI